MLLLCFALIYVEFSKSSLRCLTIVRMSVLIESRYLTLYLTNTFKQYSKCMFFLLNIIFIFSESVPLYS